MFPLLTHKSENKWFAFKRYSLFFKRYALRPLRFAIYAMLFTLCAMPLSAAFAATITIAWDANTEPDAAGYRVHYGASSGNYQYSVDVGNHTSCTISGLNEGTTYYIAATAYNSSNYESSFSEELSHTIPQPLPPPPPADTDGDGILDNDEIDLYGTNPDKADTDGDGIIDGDELNFWGDNWNADSDGDGVANLIDQDSDNDGFTDGQELISGFDPANSNSKPIIVKIWFEAENGYLNSPMEIAVDDEASNNEYILIPSGNGNNLDPNSNAGYAEYTFEIPAPGEYVIWGRVNSATTARDSFFVSVDGNEYALWDTQVSNTWTWDKVANRDVADPVIVYLEAGEHSLIVKHREPLTKIDKILITNDLAYVPEGLSEENTPQPPPVIDTDGDGLFDNDETNVYGTNPDKSDTDGDGINDGEELNFWGDSWNVDSDGDGKINLLDLDSDNDSYSDGQERDTGFDPLNSESNPGSVKIWFEAESGFLNMPMEISTDDTASGGEYILIPKGNRNNLDPNAETGYANYTFQIPVAGEYVIWGRVNSATPARNSFFVSIDGNEYALWDTQVSKNWVWDQVANRKIADPVIVYLEAGEHTLIVKHREPLTKIDKIFITNDLEYIPD